MAEETTTTEQQPPEGEPGTTSTEQQSAPQSDPGQPPVKPEKFADVLAGLDDASRALVQAELNRKNNEAKNLRTRLGEAEPKARAHDEAQSAQQSAEDRAAERERAATEKADRAVQRMVRSEVRALAADKFADPDDAAAFLDASQYLGSDGEPDTDAIRSALDDLIARKPHLRRPDPKPRPPAPNPAQGSSSAGPAPVTGPGRGRELFEARHGKRAAAS